jgi:hypothetical protein
MKIASLCDRALSAIPALQDDVLSEIWGFYSRYTQMEGQKINAIANANDGSQISAAFILAKSNIATLESLTNCLERHRGQPCVNPEEMPFQYRK